MKIATFSLVAAALVSPVVSRDGEPDTYLESDSTTKFVYSGFNPSGSYNEITFMNDDTGECHSLPKKFHGPLGSLGEELSVHVRGPVHFNKFAVYLPSDNGVFKRDAEGLAKKDEEQCDQYEHHVHRHSKRALVKVTTTVLMDQNGNPIAPSNPAGGAATGAPAPDSDSNPSSGSDSSSSSGSDSSSSSAEGGYQRVSHWRPGESENCTFLNNFGGAGSGVFSYDLGNSLSYANADNTGASGGPVPLGDVYIGSNSEFTIMSGLSCGDESENHGCGYYRPGSPALHGWYGIHKIFVFDFEMPSTSDNGFNGDIPAIWFLHALIPRTLQYGKQDCSCWVSGCGELDVFEILEKGDKNMITAYHGKQNGNGGSPKYIIRPEQGPMKTVVIFKDGCVHVMQVDYSVAFEDVLSTSQVDDWVNAPGTEIRVY